MKKNIAVVGCGYCKNLVRNFSELGVLAAVCDPNTDLAKHYCDLYAVQDCSFAEIIEDPQIDGVVLAVPASLHAQLAIEAMSAGKNVFVEKPLAMNQNEACEMITVAKAHNVELMVGHLLNTILDSSRCVS